MPRLCGYCLGALASMYTNIMRAEIFCSLSAGCYGYLWAKHGRYDSLALQIVICVYFYLCNFGRTNLTLF